MVSFSLFQKQMRVWPWRAALWQGPLPGGLLLRVCAERAPLPWPAIRVRGLLACVTVLHRGVKPPKNQSECWLNIYRLYYPYRFL